MSTTETQQTKSHMRTPKSKVPSLEAHPHRSDKSDDTMPSRYLLLRQKSGEPCEIVLVDANKPEEILASGGRWQMRHRFDDLRTGQYAGVPAYNLKRNQRGGIRGRMIRGRMVKLEPTTA